MLGSSFGLHAVGPLADGSSVSRLAAYTWPYQLTGMLKHGAELAGWMLLATGMFAGVWPSMEKDPGALRAVAATLTLGRLWPTAPRPVNDGQR